MMSGKKRGEGVSDLRASLVSAGHIELDVTPQGSSIGKDAAFPHRDSDISSIGDMDMTLEKVDDQDIRAKENSTLITLEVISGRVMFLLLAISYLTFLGSYMADYFTIADNGRTYHSLGNQMCPTGNIFADMGVYSNDTNNYGCMASPGVWTGEVLDLNNVISVSMQLEYTNTSKFAYSSDWGAPLGAVNYDVELWACYNDRGCGMKFDKTEVDTSTSEWEKVLVLPTDTDQHLLSSFYDIDLENNKIAVPLINITFQNQESIPTNGIVKSYFVLVTYYDENNATSVYLNDPNSKYSFMVIERPTAYYENIGIVVLTFLTIISTVGFVYLVHKHQGWAWLPEQVWLVIYFCGIVLFQNPVYLYLNWVPYPSVGAAFASYTLDSISNVVFLVMWLLFADSIHCRDASEKHNAVMQNRVSVGSSTTILNRHMMKEFWRFYGPKVLFGFVFIAVSLTLLTYQFPSVTKTTDFRSPVLAVNNWPDNIQDAYVIWSVVYFCLFTCWIVWWFRRVYTSGTTLNEVPYMQTRYLQLSFRFFTSQAVLVFIYYFVQYATTMSLFLTGDDSTAALMLLSNQGNGVRTTITDEVNTIFRQQTQLFGKAIFLTVYLGVLGFLFLPSAVLQTKGAVALAATTFVIKEKSLRPVVRSRHRAIRRMKAGLAGNLNKMIMNAKPDVFCVEIALEMLHVAFEAYYDPDDTPTISGSGPINVEIGGFTYVGCIYNPELETFCIITRHRESRKLVVSFRGSRVSKHWKSNLDYGKVDFDIERMTLPGVDAADGLDTSSDHHHHHAHHGGVTTNPLAAADGSSVSPDRASRGSAHSNHSFHSAQEGNDNAVRSDEEDDNSFFSANHWDDMYADTYSDSEGEEGDEIPAFDRTTSMRDTFIEPIAPLVEPVARALGNATETVGDMVMSAARVTPVLGNLVKEQVHKGFWEAYEKVREELHTIVRAELKTEPAAKLVFAGHSLGGALATIASFDFSVHTMPRVNAYHKARYTSEKEKGSSKLGPRAPTASITLYNFGSPKVGNGPFVNKFDRLVPDSFRVVVDGDIVPTMPLTGYSHVGTSIVIDGKGFGSIIIDPSIVERWLRPSKRGISTHFLDQYRAGLEGILVVHNAISAASAFTKPAERRPSALTAPPEKFDYRTALTNRMGEQLALDEGERWEDSSDDDEGGGGGGGGGSIGSGRSSKHEVASAAAATAHNDADHGDNEGTEAAGGGDNGGERVSEWYEKEEGGNTDANKQKKKKKKNQINFQLPFVSYAYAQAYTNLYARFNRSAQQKQMEETLQSQSVPFRSAGADASFERMSNPGSPMRAYDKDD
jgi:hypothetical protein